MVTKTGRAGLIHLWWFVAILIIAIGSIVFLTVYKTDKIIAQAEKNQTQMIETFRYLRAEPEWKMLTDSLGRYYIDSVQVATSEQARRIEGHLINTATRQLTEYSDIIVKEASSLNETLILWATVLTLLSIIFTFLGFMELRDRFSAVEDKRREMDEVIEKAAMEVDYKIQEVYNALSGVQDKRQEMDEVLINAQNSMANITDRFEDLSVSAIEDIDGKIKEIDLLKQEIKENERVSFYNLNVQSALLKPSEEEQLKLFKSLAQKINDDPLLSSDRKQELLADLFINIARNFEKSGNLTDAIDYYTKSYDLKPSYKLLVRRGLSYINNNDPENSVKDFLKAIETAPDHPEAYNYVGNYYKNRKDYQTAINNYTMAIGLNPDYLDAYFNRGEANYELEQYQNALKDYNTVIDKNPMYIQAYRNRGLVYKSLNMIEEALDDFEKCIELDTDNQQECKYLAQQEINKIKEIDEE